MVESYNKLREFYLWLVRRSGDNNLEATSHESTPNDNEPHGGIRSFMKKQKLKVVDSINAQGGATPHTLCSAM